MESENNQLTPAMIQYYELKEQNRDAILFFRMGDFYEMFDDDAIIANKILGIAVTSRNKNAIKPTPLAGIPFHAKEKYLPMLIEAGYKVAIAEQVSDPNLKGIVKREIIRVVTPATIGLEGESYENANSNIISITNTNNIYGLSILNIGENKWKTCEFKDFESLENELIKVGPKEVVIEKKLFGNEKIKQTLERKYMLNIYFFEAKKDAYKHLINHFQTTNLIGFGIENYSEAIRSSSMLLEYLTTNQKADFDFLRSISYLDLNNFLSLDDSTIKSLDLVYNIATKSSKEGTLFGILNKTKTISGSNLMFESILKPLNNKDNIEKRQEFIQAFLDDKILLDKIRDKLQSVSNINGILNRIALNRTTPRDLINLKNSLKSLLEIIEIIKKSNNKNLSDLIKEL
ncbi:MAG: hypothetical protein PHI37_02025 [Candidatus Gracilibacteria bacterium]|nr:hypothetical protein [Candidatus Gracilibacteria bacterium]